MKIQNTLLTAIVLILLNILFYNINTVSYRMEKPHSMAENNEKAVVQLVEKILDMNTTMAKSNSSYSKDLSINDFKKLLLENERKSLNTENELQLYIEKLEKKLNDKTGSPFRAVIPGANNKAKLLTDKEILKKSVAARKTNNSTVNYDLIDKMDDIYFSSSNQIRGVEEVNNNSTVTKDLEEFDRYVNYVSPDVLKRQKTKMKRRDYIPAETLLATNNYYSDDELKNYLTAKKLRKDLKGYCINLLVTDKMLPPNHPIFEHFGGLMMEEVSENEYRYFIGSFTTRNGANKHLENVLHSKFPEAEVVFYKKGNRKSNLWQFFFGPLG